jgi:DNA-binding LacI/PurR family transcriptional regulator
MARTRMADIARLASVSTATVSRVLQSPDRVRDTTRKRVLGVMRKQGYVYHAGAADLARRRSTVLGLVIPTIDSSLHSRFTRGVQDAAAEHGYSVLISSTNYDADAELEMVRLLGQRRVAGIILGGMTSGRIEDFRIAAELGVPMVCGAESELTDGAGFVGIDNYAAAVPMAGYVASLGHTQVAVLAGPESIRGPRRRRDGLVEGLAGQGIAVPPDRCLHTPIDLAEGRDATAELLRQVDPPTAILCVSDVLAMGALAAARDAGLSVPHELSVTGFDDADFAAFCTPSLTTVRVPVYQMGYRAVEVLLKAAANTDAAQDGDDPAPRRELLPTDLIIRGSCWTRNPPR